MRGPKGSFSTKQIKGFQMQQVNQNEPVCGAGMLVFADKDGHLKSATIYEFHFNQPATKEQCFNLVTMLNADEEVTEEGDALELLCLALREIESDKDDEMITQEQFMYDWEVLHWWISSLLESPHWCVVFVLNEENVGGMGWQPLTAEEFTKRKQDIQDRLDLIAA